MYALIVTETRLFLREPLAVFFGIAFPSVLLLVLGTAIPGFTAPTDDLGGRRPIDLYLPIVMALAIATVTMVTLLTGLSTYRERGVLRRLAVTPVRPSALLGAQLAVNTLALLVGVLAASTVAAVRFDVAAPGNPVGLAAAFVLGTAAMGAVALVIAALAPTARAASGLGSLVYFPMMFFAGVWTPGPAMPALAQRIADFTPLGAASQAMQSAYHGTWPSPLHVVVMLGFVAVLGTLAVRRFRWS